MLAVAMQARGPMVGAVVAAPAKEVGVVLVVAAMVATQGQATAATFTHPHQRLVPGAAAWAREALVA